MFDTYLFLYSGVSGSKGERYESFSLLFKFAFRGLPGFDGESKMGPPGPKVVVPRKINSFFVLRVPREQESKGKRYVESF